MQKTFNKTALGLILCLVMLLCAGVALTAKRDDCTLAYSVLCTVNGEYARAQQLLLAHRFHTYEGGEGYLTQHHAWLHFLMGRRLLDPHHYKYTFDEEAMLGLLDVDTVFAAEPVFTRLRGVSAPGGFLLRGFETHRGMSDGNEPVLFRREDGSPIGFGHGRLWATYLHRCFDDAGFRRHVIDAVRLQRASL